MSRRTKVGGDEIETLDEDIEDDYCGHKEKALPTGSLTINVLSKEPPLMALPSFAAVGFL